MVSYLPIEFRHEPTPPTDFHAREIMRTLLLLSLLILAPLARPADMAQELYVGEVVVADQGGGERARTLPLALEHVLQKLSGLRQFDDYPLLGPALERAPEMVLSYYYAKVPGPEADGSESEELRLVARFAEAAVDEMARALQLPLWQPQRNPLTAWLIIDDGLDRRIMPLEYGYAQQAMEQVADRRGQPLVWPDPDPEGSYAVDEQILWGGYTEDLAQPGGDGVLIAAARREGLEWGVRINLGFRGQHWSWRQNDIDLVVALSEGMQQVIDQVATVQTIAASDLGSWQQDLTVSGLAGAQHYRRCLAYLQGISLVERVEVVSARTGAVTFRLGLSAMPSYLEEILESGQVLQRSEEGDSWLLAGALAGALPDDG
jgi:hypothetical protein